VEALERVQEQERVDADAVVGGDDRGARTGALQRHPHGAGPGVNVMVFESSRVSVKSICTATVSVGLGMLPTGSV
jgi:hypothetical protein